MSAPSSYYRGVGKTEELLQRSQALVSRIFFLIGFHLSDLSVVKLDVFTEKKILPPHPPPHVLPPHGPSPAPK